MKIAHIADLHFCREHADEVFKSLRFFEDYVRKNPVDLILIAGDLFDSATLNTENAGFTDFISAIKRLGDAAPTAMVYGTPSHDVDGSLDIFKTINSTYGITILEPGQAYFLSQFPAELYSEKNIMECAEAGVPRVHNELAILFGIPEPRKKYLLANNTVGKDETEEAIRDAMHKMCFLLASKRREYADLPCFVLYHGEVAGTSYQNDQTIERGTGISITIDDLGDIGADYYALGHIHKPQKIGNLNAHYAGSIYPKNFGETHQASFKVVDIEPALNNERLISVNTVDFPHPQNMKIEVKDWRANAGLKKNEIFGKRVWVEFICTKSQRAEISIEHILAGLLSDGAVEGSRVTINEQAVETVRAAEIAEVKTPEAKFEVWAHNSNIEAKPSVKEKIIAIENEIALGSAKASGEWELVSLHLRGAIGIKKGIHQDEISINFDEYANGLIALVGANGKGKTTLIENCHPYPELLTRKKGTLREHFFLKDSFREVIYRNRADGTLRKFVIQIDGQNKTGSCKYFIYKQTAGLVGNEWEPLPGVDGNLKPYEEALIGLFGPIELFLRTAFITQRPTKNLPDLTDATAGDKKALFVALAGIDYLQDFSDAATEKSKQEAAKTHDAEIRMQMLEGAVSRKQAETNVLQQSEADLRDKQKQLSAVTEQGKIAKADMDAKQEAWNTEQTRARQETEAKSAVDKTATEITSLNADISGYQSAAKNKPLYEAKIAEYETLQKTIESENAKKQTVTESNLKKQQDFAKVKTAFDEKMKVPETERDALADQRIGIERQILTAQNNIKLYERDAAEVKETCPICGQQLPAEKIPELQAKRDEFVLKIQKEKADIKKHNGNLADINKRIDELTQQVAELSFDEPEAPPPVTFDDAVLSDATGKIRQINIAEARSLLNQAQEAAVRIDGLQKQIADKTKLLEMQKSAHQKLLSTVDGAKIRADLDEAIKLHAGLGEQFSAIRAEIARTEANIEGAKRSLMEIEASEAELKTIAGNITKSKVEATEWDLIAKAFGRDGIQALELDALAPGISETANRILESAYGDRFHIEIQTTRIGGTGKNTKQIEDFLIYVTDSADSDGEATLLDNKSGGEAVWIKRAIYDAFAVIRKRNTAFAFLSCFQDETDGALDPESKTAYCRMLEAAHSESKLRHSIIITHSNEVKAMIEQKIDMEALQ